MIAPFRQLHCLKGRNHFDLSLYHTGAGEPTYAQNQVVLLRSFERRINRRIKNLGIYLPASPYPIPREARNRQLSGVCVDSSAPRPTPTRIRNRTENPSRKSVKATSRDRTTHERRLKEGEQYYQSSFRSVGSPGHVVHY